jgi:hypothetical protein
MQGKRKDEIIDVEADDSEELDIDAEHETPQSNQLAPE